LGAGINLGMALTPIFIKFIGRYKIRTLHPVLRFALRFVAKMNHHAKKSLEGLTLLKFLLIYLLSSHSLPELCRLISPTRFSHH